MVGHKNMVSKVYTVLVNFKGGVPTTLCSFVRLSVIPSQIGQNQTGMSVPRPPYKGSLYAHRGGGHKVPGQCKIYHGPGNPL